MRSKYPNKIKVLQYKGDLTTSKRKYINSNRVVANCRDKGSLQKKPTHFVLINPTTIISNGRLRSYTVVLKLWVGDNGECRSPVDFSPNCLRFQDQNHSFNKVIMALSVKEDQLSQTTVKSLCRHTFYLQIYLICISLTNQVTLDS